MRRAAAGPAPDRVSAAGPPSGAAPRGGATSAAFGAAAAKAQRTGPSARAEDGGRLAGVKRCRGRLRLQVRPRGEGGRRRG